jgi:hypothetical protein
LALAAVWTRTFVPSLCSWPVIAKKWASAKSGGTAKKTGPSVADAFGGIEMSGLPMKRNPASCWYCSSAIGMSVVVAWTLAGWRRR